MKILLLIGLMMLSFESGSQVYYPPIYQPYYIQPYQMQQSNGGTFIINPASSGHYQLQPPPQVKAWVPLQQPVPQIQPLQIPNYQHNYRH